MPEPLELRLRGRERCRVAVAERDDRNPGAVIEVRPALVVPDPRALAADEGHRSARVRRQDGATK